jgi:hypothetical protein
MFTDVGDGLAVPSKDVDEYAAKHQVTRDEARAQIRAEFVATRTQDK